MHTAELFIRHVGVDLGGGDVGLFGNLTLRNLGLKCKYE